MDKKDLVEFCKIVTGLAELTPNARLSDVTLELMFCALEKYDIKQIKTAAIAIIQRPSKRYVCMPTPGDIIAEIEGVGGETGTKHKAIVAWSKMINAIKTVGGYRSVVFDDPVLVTVILSYFGGWVNLCNTLPENEKDLQWIRKEFYDQYETFFQSGNNSVAKLTGQYEKDAYGNIKEPAYIGDEVEAKRLLKEHGKARLTGDLKVITGGIG